MPNPELLAYKGQLSMARARRANLDAEATGIMQQLRMLLRIGQETVQVKMDQVEAMTARLGELIAEMKKIDQTISDLEEMVG